MKKETKALIEWIKAQIYIATKLDNSYRVTQEAAETHKKLEADAKDFLNSLPEIESHLCRGGYIQDKNGTPCCHEDTVTFQSCSESKKIREGQLWWFNKEGAFFIRDRLADWKLKEIKWFEKVEE